MKPKHGNAYPVQIGVGWVTDAAGGVGISIKLQPGTVLSHRDCEDHYLGLWPITNAADGFREPDVDVDTTGFDDPGF